MTKTLVLGATGNIGSQVAKILLEQKANVVIGVRKPHEAAAEALKKQGAEVREFDFDKKATVGKALEGIHSLFLLPPFGEKLTEPVKLVVDEAKAAGIKFIVKLSAIGADSKDSLHVLKEHGESDDYVKSSGIPYTILQPTFFTTNFLWQVGPITTQGAFYGSSGEGKTTFITPRDIANSAAHVLLSPEKHKDQTYVLTGPELLSSADVAAIFSLVLRKEIKYIDLDSKTQSASLVKSGSPAWQATDVVGLEQAKKEERFTSVNSNVKKITGKWPQYFREWVEENKSIFTLSISPLSDSTKKAFAGKLAVVTGANRGIGLAIGTLLAKLGLHVVFTARDEKSKEIVENLHKEGLKDVKFHALDVTSASSVAAFKDYLVKEHKGKVDILINNAGLGASFAVDFFGFTPEEIQKVFETNTIGAIRVLQAVADVMKTHNSGTGRIINISSGAGTWAAQQGPAFAYTLSKLGLNAANQASSLAARRDEKTKNISIVAMCPGPIKTDMSVVAGIDVSTFGTVHTAEYAAEEILAIAFAENINVLHGKFFRHGKELSY